MTSLSFTPRKILLIDDDAASALLLCRKVGRAFPSATIHQITSALAGSAVRAGVADFVITTYRLVGRRAPDLIKELRQIDGLIPILVISGMPVYRQDCFAAGATLFASYEDDLAAVVNAEVVRLQHGRPAVAEAGQAVG